ncbi:MAG: hypothetical protein KKF67_00890 [Nanoarchaeota archaeon]|nr:hypothetical protein [Nanoarchaeota archaeon]
MKILVIDDSRNLEEIAYLGNRNSAFAFIGSMMTLSLSFRRICDSFYTTLNFRDITQTSKPTTQKINPRYTLNHFRPYMQKARNRL